MPTFMIASSRGGRVRTMPDPLVHDLIFSSVAGSRRWDDGPCIAFHTSRLIVHLSHSTPAAFDTDYHYCVP